jgi:hypothetical protein
MKWSAISAAAVALLPLVSGALTTEEYDSGEVMEFMMSAKEASWAKQRALGNYDSKKWNGFSKKRHDKNVIKCKNGKAEAVKGDANQTYLCKDIVSSRTKFRDCKADHIVQDLYDFKTHAELGDAVGEGSGSWGWTHKPTGREFIAIGQTYGAAFAEVTKQGQLEYVGRLPASNDSVIWREIKKVGDTLIVGSEGAGHGIQFFDMKKLLKLSPKNPKTFDVKKDIGWMNITDGIPGRSHNVVANEEAGYAVAVGCGGRAGRNDTCAGGPIFINMDDPYNPYQTGCAPQDG